MERETRGASPQSEPTAPAPYEPPAVAWEEAFDPVALSPCDASQYGPDGCPY